MGGITRLFKENRVVYLQCFLIALMLVVIYSSFGGWLFEQPEAPIQSSLTVQDTNGSDGGNNGIVELTDIGWREIFSPDQLVDMRKAFLALSLVAVFVLVFVRREHGRWKRPKIDDAWRGSFASFTTILIAGAAWDIAELAGAVDTFTPVVLNLPFISGTLIVAAILWVLPKDRPWAQRWTGILLLAANIVLLAHIFVYQRREDLPSWAQRMAGSDLPGVSAESAIDSPYSYGICMLQPGEETRSIPMQWMQWDLYDDPGGTFVVISHHRNGDAIEDVIDADLVREELPTKGVTSVSFRGSLVTGSSFQLWLKKGRDNPCKQM